MDTTGYVDVVEDEGRRLRAAVRRADVRAVVPSAPEWSVADLAWHVAEVQWFWGAIVADLLDDVDGLEELDRPSDADLPELLASNGAALVDALRRRDPDDRCWSWHQDGGHVGWVARRQAHEALIHRVDAELAADGRVADTTPALAADGVDELLVGLLALPSWTTFAPDGTAVAVLATDDARRWHVEIGRVTGTSPRSGEAVDQEAVRVRRGGSETDEVGATLSGRAWDVDRWLWGRGPADPLRMAGDRGLLHQLRSIAEID